MEIKYTAAYSLPIFLFRWRKREGHWEYTYMLSLCLLLWKVMDDQDCPITSFANLKNWGSGRAKFLQHELIIANCGRDIVLGELGIKDFNLNPLRLQAPILEWDKDLMCRVLPGRRILIWTFNDECVQVLIAAPLVLSPLSLNCDWWECNTLLYQDLHHITFDVLAENGGDIITAWPGSNKQWTRRSRRNNSKMISCRKPLF